MEKLVVGIGDIKVSNNIDSEIKTFALGSCVAVIVYDKKNMIAGMVHIALPDSTANDEKAKQLPGYFADTGLPLLFTELEKLGAEKRFSWIKMAGGASIADPNSYFDIGKRNILAIRKLLWKRHLAVISEDVGGNFSRTVSINVGSGEVIISSGGKKWNI